MIVSYLFSSISDFYLVVNQIETSISSYKGQGILNLLVFIVFMPFLVISFVMMVKSLKSKEDAPYHAVLILLIGTILLFCCVTVINLWKTITLINIYNEGILSQQNSPEIVTIYKSNKLNVIISLLFCLIQASLCLGSAIAMHVFWKKEKMDQHQSIKVTEDETINTAPTDNSF